MPNLDIPRYVKELILCPDRDKAGISAARRSNEIYNAGKRVSSVSILLPEKRKLANGKYCDFNDILMGR